MKRLSGLTGYGRAGSGKRPLYHQGVGHTIPRSPHPQSKPVILETERLTLRPLAAEDARALHRIMSDPQAVAHWDIAAIEDPDVVDTMVEAQIREMAEGLAFYWSVVRVSEGWFLGSCDLSEIDRKKHFAEIGFVLGHDASRDGFGLEALRAVLSHAASLSLKRLFARTPVGAERSEAMLAELGFKTQGYQRGHIQRDGERRDYRLFGLTL